MLPNVRSGYCAWGSIYAKVEDGLAYRNISAQKEVVTSVRFRTYTRIYKCEPLDGWDNPVCSSSRYHRGSVIVCQNIFTLPTMLTLSICSRRAFPKPKLLASST